MKESITSITNVAEKAKVTEEVASFEHRNNAKVCRCERYNIFVLVVIFCFTGLLCWMAIWIDPLDKDLTRVGGFLENDYGWNEPQEYFEEPLFHLARYHEAYNRFFPVIVFGDSFSMNQKSGWQNYFVDQTSSSILTFVSNHGFVLADILQNRTFKESPPELLIYEVAERNLLERTYKDMVTQCCTKISNNAHEEFVPRLQPFYKTRTNFMTRDKGGLKAFSIDTAADFVRKSILKFIFGEQATDVRLTQLKKKNIFSHYRSDELLYYKKDLRSNRYSKKERSEIIKQLMNIKKRVESNGKTRFLLLVAPNKLTTYWAYLVSPPSQEPVIIKEIREVFPSESPPIDQLLKDMVEKGVIDVYLPNDTHWGSAGHKAAAVSLVHFLSR